MTKRWELLVKAGEKTHRQAVKAETLAMAAWALKCMLGDLEDRGVFHDDADTVEASVKPVKP